MSGAGTTIVVSSQDGRTVTGHAGHTRKWLVFRTDDSGKPALVDQVELMPNQVFHRFTSSSPHPLDGASVLITRFSGDGFIKKMRKRGVEVRHTSETDPQKAVADFLSGKLAPPARRLMAIVCKIRDAFSKEH